MATGFFCLFVFAFVSLITTAKGGDFLWSNLEYELLLCFRFPQKI